MSTQIIKSNIRKYTKDQLPNTIFELDEYGVETATIKKVCIVFTNDNKMYVTDNNGTPILQSDNIFSNGFVDDLYIIPEDERLKEKVYITADRKAYIWTGSDFEPLNLGAIEHIWLAEVNTFADIATTYTNPVHYNAVAVRIDETYEGNRTWYAFDKGSDTWVFKGLYFGDFRNVSVSVDRDTLITANTDYDFSTKYLVGESQLSVYLDGTLLVKGTDFIEIGIEGDYSSTIQFLYDIPTTCQLVFVKSIARQDTVTPFKVTHAEIGQYGMFATEDIPDTYLVCDGSELDRKQFSKLFSKIGTRYGQGNGSTTFNLPDTRGYFPRAWDSTNIIDTETRVLGSVQGDAIRNITGSIFKISETWNTSGHTTGAFTKLLGHSGVNTPSSTDSSNSGGFTFDASRVVPTANENRPKNIAVLMCIKYKMF